MNTTPIEPAYFSIRELAAYLSISYRTAFNLVKAGAVPSVRVGGQHRIPRAELDRQLRERATR